jgi:malate synthase
MADFEDALSPPWSIVGGGPDLLHGRGPPTQLDYTSPEGKTLRPGRTPRHPGRCGPRGWQPRRTQNKKKKDTCWWTGRGPAPAALCSGRLSAFLLSNHNARDFSPAAAGTLLSIVPKAGARPGEEARLWNEVFEASQAITGPSPGDRSAATVLVETVLAAVPDRTRSSRAARARRRLNAGRWDYLFSIIKNFRHRPEFVLPDRPSHMTCRSCAATPSCCADRVHAGRPRDRRHVPRSSQPGTRR